LLVLFFFVVFSILIVIAVYDIRHKVIPDKLVYTFVAISFLAIFVNFSGIGPLLIIPSYIYFLAGPILALPFALIWLLSRGRWMGFGDAKLMLGIGWLLGLSMGAAAIILAFWVGAIISLGLMLFSYKKMNMKTEVPFAPFLILSTIIVFIFSLDVLALSSIFQF
jgi:prepilin signal peptidase PulO-like enzyme (type II secretory pathway)